MKELVVLGIDTSNYTTSVAILTCDGRLLANLKRPLPVKPGERGLRQSDAVFAHTVNIPELMKEAAEILADKTVIAVGVSATPRNEKGSYMPCFLTGVACAESISAALGVKLYKFSHQCGHIMAAVYSAGDEELLGRDFGAFHISGGTTELVRVSPSESGFDTKLLGGTADLNAGQVIDRVGVMLGLPFPSGEELEKLSQGMPMTKGIKLSVKGFDCNMAGAENIAKKMLNDGRSREDIAAFALDFVIKTVDKMTENIMQMYTDLPILYAGGVAACGRMKTVFEKKYDCAFALPQYSGDNAAGTALLAREKFLRKR